LDKLNDELRDVTKVMTKNIEDLLYRGDSLERMGDMSSRLREDARKYKRAAVKMNWELLLKQVSHVLLQTSTFTLFVLGIELTTYSMDQSLDWLSLSSFSSGGDFSHDEDGMMLIGVEFALSCIDQL
jgi:hypothetical protein